jgi:hypothetical protein
MDFRLRIRRKNKGFEGERRKGGGSLDLILKEKVVILKVILNAG